MHTYYYTLTPKLRSKEVAVCNIFAIFVENYPDNEKIIRFPDSNIYHSDRHSAGAVLYNP